MFKLAKMSVSKDQRQALYISALVFTLYFFLAVKTDFLLIFAIFLGLILTLCLVYLIVKHPGYGVGIMIIGTSLDVMGKIPGTPVTIFHLGVAITIVVWFIQILQSTKISIYSTNFDIPLGIFLVLISLSLIYTPDKLDAFVNYMRLLALIIVMYVTINVISDRWTLLIAMLAFLLSAFVLAIFAITSISKASTSLMQMAIGFSKVFARYGVTFEDPNYFASFLMIALAISSSLIFNGGIRIIFRLLLIFISTIIFVALIGTFSRAAWVALVPAMTIVVFYSPHRKIIFFTAILLLFLSVIILWNSILFKSVITRFSSLASLTSDPSSMTRLYLLKGGWNMLQDSFFLGVGYRGFPVIYERLYRPGSQVLFDVFESHTLPMEVLAELGIFGFILFMLIFYRYFKFAFGAIKKTIHPFYRSSLIGIVAAMVGYMTNALFSPGQLNGNFLWIGLGLTYAIPRLANETDKKD